MDLSSPAATTVRRLAGALILQLVMERMLSLLPTSSRASEPVPVPVAGLKAEPRKEDLAIQNAIDEVLEYHRTHRPRNTAKNCEPKQWE